MVFSAGEIFDIVIMSLAVGYIFSGLIPQQPQRNFDPLLQVKRGFDWHQYKLAIIVAAPAVILHEFGHKFVALAYGLTAEFNAAYLWLGIGVALKFFSAPFIFLVPAYVSISGAATPFTFGLTALAGPLVNAVLWILPTLAVKQNLIKRKYVPLALLMAKVNLFLFVFNLIPLPGFDGSKVATAIMSYF